MINFSAILHLTLVMVLPIILRLSIVIACAIDRKHKQMAYPVVQEQDTMVKVSSPPLIPLSPAAFLMKMWLVN